MCSSFVHTINKKIDRGLRKAFRKSLCLCIFLSPNESCFAFLTWLFGKHCRKKLPLSEIPFALTHFMSLASFHGPWKDQKTGGFQLFLGSIVRDQGLIRISIHSFYDRQKCLSVNLLITGNVITSYVCS